jgi:hypothetical protein
MHLRTAIVALLVVGWYAPTRSYASCGDYVTMQPHREYVTLQPSPTFDFGPRLNADAARLDPGSFADRIDTTPAPARPRCRCPYSPLTPERVPCQGPWCSNSPGPLTPVPTSVEKPHEQWGLYAGDMAPGTSDPIPHRFLSDHAERIHRVSPIYHPPRSA